MKEAHGASFCLREQERSEDLPGCRLPLRGSHHASSYLLFNMIVLQSEASGAPPKIEGVTRP